VYSDPVSPVQSCDMKPDNSNLFDRLMAEPVVQLPSAQLGAKPKHKTATIDIRNTVYQWYEEAVQEVERDLSLDINHLDKNGRHERRLIGTRKHNYEPVYPTRDIQPTTTLLRDFDPCFGNVEELSEDTTTDSEAENEHTKYVSNKMRSASAMSDVANKSIGDEVVVATDRKKSAPEQNEDIGEIDDVDEIKKRLKNQENYKFESAKSSPSRLSSLKFGSPKKINFGPPKPPRHFEYSSLAHDSPKERPARKEAKLKSPKELFGSRRKGKVEICDKLEKSDTNHSEYVQENLYVTLPCDRLQEFEPDGRCNDSPSLPPPLPNSLPPSAIKPKQTMYENVWIERSSPELETFKSKSLSSLSQQTEHLRAATPDRYEDSPPTLPVRGSTPASRAGTPASRGGTPSSRDETLGSRGGTPGSRGGNLVSRADTPGSRGGTPGSRGGTPGSRGGSVGSEDERSRRTPPTLPPRRGSQLSSVTISTSKTESFGSQSSLATSGSNTSGSNNSKESATTTDSKDVKGALKKLSSGRSFSVGNLKLSRLPSMAENLKKKVTDQLKAVNDVATSTNTDLKHSPILSSTALEDTDEDELTSSVADLSLFPGADSINLGDWSQLTVGAGSSPQFSSNLYLFSRRKKHFLLKWFVVCGSSSVVKWYNQDASTPQTKPKEMIMLNNIFTISQKTELHMGPEFQELYCFNIAAINSSGKFNNYLVGCLTSTERDTVMEKIVQILGPRLNNFDMTDCTRIGWAYMKVRFAASWSLSWLYLTEKSIAFQTTESDHFQTINLKKTKDVNIRKDCKSLEPPAGFSKHPVLVIDFNDRSMYILPGAPSETNTWKASIEQIAFTNTNRLCDQQVTHENVPVLVDKCLKFVFSHGVMTEGIYRLAGVNTKINKLLTEFRSNAWAVEISRDDYSEHDVANVVKRFVRQLESPLLTDELRQAFLATARIPDQDTKLTTYKSLLSKLPDVNHATMRKLLGHLYTVSSQSDKNLMPVFNLAPLWGPNMLIVDGQAGQGFGETREETDVCADLITNYPYLFDVEMEELDKERKLVSVLERINHPTPSTVKRSGDVIMWCYLHSRSGKCVSVTLHPSLTAGDAMKQVARETGSNNLQGLLMHEVVLGEFLERPIHYSEKLLDLTLRWGVWEDDDRRNNYLILKSNQIYDEALPCAIPPISIFSEIQFCDNKAKSKFGKFLFSVANANITCHKEDKNGHKIESQCWPVEDIIWYLGCEKKRNAPHSLNLTFINKHEPIRTKETPLFGRVLSFSSRELYTKWVAGLLVAEYGTDITQNNLVLVD